MAVTIDTVPVGNINNANDPATGGVFGGVDHAYRIGTTEVTNAQYVAFLNAKAASDPLALYSTNMGSVASGGITRSGVSGSFTYAVKTNMGNKPVNFVSWYDSIRFANWLNNGQGAGDTETGAYTLGALGAGGVPTVATIARESGATWFLTSENEWYKAAYHQPAAQGGDTDSYWRFPTASNSVPTVATANSVGDISNPGTNVANYNSGADWNSQDGNVTTVGSAGLSSRSFYGTSDQGGNVAEWNETFFGPSPSRGELGGSWGSNGSDQLNAGFRSSFSPTVEASTLGFRVASVPEPSTMFLACLAATGLAISSIRRRRKCGTIERAVRDHP